MMSLAVGIGFGVMALFMLTAFTGAPYVPTKRGEVDEAFTELRPLSATDTVLDIGSGDGVVLARVARYGARAVGYEINPILVLLARFRLRKYGGLAEVRLTNFWRTPFPEGVTVVYTFGDSRDIPKMYKKVQAEASRLNRAIDLVSYGFRVPGVREDGTHRAHFLYRITPLH